ncbi:MAG: zf-HC2 domain-containing protein [Gemmatimonadota bacterium]|nr:zf-HC2 domain-containing protein [Gemmatimonadota bacterium]
MNEHLTEQKIAAYVDGTLSRIEREEIESHLADCEPCGQDVLVTSRTMRRTRRERRARVATRWAGAAAVVLVLFGVARTVSVVEGPRTPVLRDGGTGDPAVRVVRPANRSVLARDSLTFVWRGVTSDAAYTFTLADGRGDVLWRMETADTLVSLDRDVALRPGATYYWYVDAIYGDGRRAESGTLQITAGR